MAASSVANTFPSQDNNNTGRYREVSFSSYLNKSDEAFIRRLAEESIAQNKKKQEQEDDDEIGVFGAEKYFNGGIDDEGMTMTTPRTRRDFQQKQTVVAVLAASHDSRPATPRLKSESSSCNSRSLLLMKSSNNNSWRRPRQKSGRGKGLLYGLACRCYCNDKDSVAVEAKEEQIGEISFRGNAGERKPIPAGEQILDSEDLILKQQQKENYCFSFPATCSGNNPKTQPWWASGAEEAERDIEKEGSDASSDLFEIESLTSGRATPFRSGCPYAPSEASVEWSVVTASACAADYFSVASDQEDSATEGRGVCVAEPPSSRRRSRGTGARLSLIGCKSGEAARVASDAAYVIKGERAKAEALVGKSAACRASSRSFPSNRYGLHNQHRPILNLTLPSRPFSPPTSRLGKVNDLEFHR